jgi:hypothetical protein
MSSNRIGQARVSILPFGDVHWMHPRTAGCLGTSVRVEDGGRRAHKREVGDWRAARTKTRVCSTATA